MKLIINFKLLIVLALLAGCTTSEVPRKQYTQIKAGQSRAEVIKLLGRPTWNFEKMPRFATAPSGWNCSAWDQRTMPVMIWYDEYTNPVHVRIEQEIQVYLKSDGTVCKVDKFERRW